MIAGKPKINKNNIIVKKSLTLKDIKNTKCYFEPVAIIEHEGFMNKDGSSFGHYRAEVKTKSKKWYRTSDDSLPELIQEDKITKQGYIFLFRNKGI